jgi:hypothetical protein
VIADVERRFRPGAVAQALDGWARFVRSAEVDSHSPVMCLHADCQWRDPLVLRDALRVALLALPVRAARELRALVAPLDDTYLARATPTPETAWIRDLLDGHPPMWEPSFAVAFELVSAGWLLVDVDDGRGPQRLYASFLTPAMDDLLAACAAVADGAPHARLTWNGEPTGYRWLFDADRFGVARVRLMVLADAGLTDVDGHPVIDVELPVRALVGTVTRAARDLLDDVGADGYLRRWETPFPTDALLALEQWSAEGVQ